MQTKNKIMRATDLRKFIEEALRKPPSKFDLYRQSDEGIKRFNLIEKILLNVHSSATKEDLLFYLTNASLEISYLKELPKLGAKGKKQVYQKYLEMARVVYVDLLKAKSDYYKKITLKELGKALNNIHPNIYWRDNRLESKPENSKRKVINLVQIHKELTRDHKYKLKMLSASKRT